MTVAALALGVTIGLALGVLGGGGSILTVPVFVYVLGYGAKEAIAMSLAVVGATSLLGALGHWRAGNVNVRVAGIFGGVAMVGTYLGARLAVFVSGGTQLVLFALVMLAAAWFMFRSDGGASEARAAGATGGGVAAGLPLALIAAEGLAVGVLTGLVGVGGGFLIVPALVLLGRVPMKEAVGTSLVVIAMKSAAGFAGYLGQVVVDWAFVAGFTAVAGAGIIAGTFVVRFVPQHALKRAFAVFLVIMGGFILYQNRGLAGPRPDDSAVHGVNGAATWAGSRNDEGGRDAHQAVLR
jgi:uncharacterized membrane protein YfcA